MIGSAEIVIVIENTEVIDYVLITHLIPAKGGNPVEYGQSIPEGSIGLLGDNTQAAFLGFYIFLLGNGLQMPHNILHRDAPKIVNLAPGENGRNDLVLFRSSQDENGMGWWFLQGFEEGIEGLLGQHVDLIDDEDPVFSHLRSDPYLFYQAANIIYRIVGGRIELQNVELIIPLLRARFSGILGLIVDHPGQDPGAGGFPYSAGAGKKKGLSEVIIFNGFQQGLGDMLLPHYFVKLLGTVLPGRYDVIFHWVKDRKFPCSSQLGRGRNLSSPEWRSLLRGSLASKSSISRARIPSLLGLSGSSMKGSGFSLKLEAKGKSGVRFFFRKFVKIYFLMASLTSRLLLGGTAFIFSLGASVSQSQSYPQDYFRYPLDLKPSVSGTFAEVRSNHFHSGIDLRTQGKIGFAVKAAAPGFVSRIKVSPYGFGRALYLRHPNGYTTVYAHLHRFNDTLENYLRQQQDALQANEVDLNLPAGKFNLERGAVIARSGNSGGSGGPHLHFEIRESTSQAILNPLLFGLPVEDSRPPRMGDLQVYQYSGHELVSLRDHRLMESQRGRYHLTGKDRLEVQYSPAFGLEVFDRLDHSWNSNGPYRLELFVGDELCYQFEAKRFTFAETRYANAHIDYSQKKCCDQSIHRLYRLPLNKFSAYQQTPTMHLPELPQDSAVEVRIRARDFHGNKAELSFEVLRRPSQGGLDFPKPREALALDPSQSLRYDQEGLRLELPKNSLYRHVYFEHRRDTSTCPDCLSDLHQVGSSRIAVHNYYQLALALEAPRGAKVDSSKLGIMSFDEDGQPADWEGGRYNQGYVQTRTREFGHFAIRQDTVAPEVTGRNFYASQVLPVGQSFALEVMDARSGLDFYEASVKGQWVRLYYDAKEDKLLLREEDLPPGEGRVTVDFLLRDKVGNETQTQVSFLRA